MPAAARGEILAGALGVAHKQRPATAPVELELLQLGAGLDVEILVDVHQRMPRKTVDRNDLRGIPRYDSLQRVGARLWDRHRLERYASER